MIYESNVTFDVKPMFSLHFVVCGCHIHPFEPLRTPKNLVVN